jgi:Na+/H+-translocating membrane pyrophosphatase
VRILASNLRFVALVFILSALVGWLSAGVYPLDLSKLDLEKTAAAASAASGVASTVAQISATMLGFLIAALAVLASIAGMRLLRNMQRTGHYQNLLARLLICAAAFALLLGLSLFAMFAPLVWLPIWQWIFGTMAAAVVSFLDAMRKFAGVLFQLKPHDQVLE